MVGSIRTLCGGDGSNIVDKRVGNAFWVVNEVYKNLAAMKQLSESFHDFDFQAEAVIASKDEAKAAAVNAALDRVQTGQDVAFTASQAALTAADRLQTGLDKAATIANSAQTALDRAATLASLNDFKGSWFGPLATNPILDPLGNSINEGDAYWNTTTKLLMIYNGAAWVSPMGFLQDGTNAISRTVLAKLREPYVSVSDYAGCDPTGATNSNAAFISALTHVASLSRVATLGENSNRIGNRSIRIPPGTYLITDPNALLNSSLFAARTHGLQFEGGGPPGSVILIYAPSVAGPMMTNNDKVLFVRFKNIQFHGTSAENDLLVSISNGTTQDYLFEDCGFTGTWRYGANLTGSNVNSEWKFNQCTFSGSWTAFLYTPAVGASDQFLNYWFFQCKYWCSSVWIDMSVGGSIKITDCDVSGYSPLSQSYLFNLRGNNHSFGVCTFDVNGLRVEQKTEFAGIIYAEWEQGAINFNGLDCSSQNFNVFAPLILSAHFNIGNASGSQISFRGCSIIGKHRYSSSQGAFGQGRATYQNTDFLSFNHPDEAFIFDESLSQTGRRRVARLTQCRGNSTANVYSDAELGWHVSASATVTKKIVSFKSAYGTLPSNADGAVTIILPLNAFITRVFIDIAAGSSVSSAAGGFTIQTNEASPTVLATLSLAALTHAGRVDNETFFRCTTRDKATIHLVPNVTNNTSIANQAVALIEYIG